MSSAIGISLPRGWSVSHLKRVTTQLHRGSAPDYAETGPVRALSQAANQANGINWSRTRFHNYAGDPRKLKGYLRPGDILINSTGTGTLGRVGYFTESPDELPSMADSHITIARANPATLDPRFSFYWLGSRPFQEFMFAALVVGATNQIELNRASLADAPIALPPLDEQRRIADYLDGETARMSQLQASLRQFIRYVDERERAVLAEQLNFGARGPDDDIPQDTRWTPLMHLTDPFRQIMYGIVLPGPNVPDGIPIVKGGDVAANRLTLEALNKTTSDIEASYARSRLRGGDIVIAIRGSVGETAVVPDELTGANLTQDAARISINQEVSADWLRIALHSPVIAHQIQLRITGATIKGINIWDLKRILIPTPSRQKQEQISKTARSILEQHELMRCKAEHHDNLVAERRQALIAAAVTGQFDVSTASGRDITD